MTPRNAPQGANKASEISMFLLKLYIQIDKDAL
jgi:hypothetical protein